MKNYNLVKRPAETVQAVIRSQWENGDSFFWFFVFMAICTGIAFFFFCAFCGII